jgi:hypothetical protein
MNRIDSFRNEELIIYLSIPNPFFGFFKNKKKIAILIFLVIPKCYRNPVEIWQNINIVISIRYRALARCSN